MANTYWTRDGGNNRIGTNNETFHASLVVVDFIEAVYSHTLIVNGSFPGVYAFFAQDPFSDGVQFISVTRNVEGNLQPQFSVASNSVHVFSSR